MNKYQRVNAKCKSILFSFKSIGNSLFSSSKIIVVVLGRICVVPFCETSHIVIVAVWARTNFREIRCFTFKLPQCHRLQICPRHQNLGASINDNAATKVIKKARASKKPDWGLIVESEMPLEESLEKVCESHYFEPKLSHSATFCQLPQTCALCTLCIVSSEMKKSQKT